MWFTGSQNTLNIEQGTRDIVKVIFHFKSESKKYSFSFWGFNFLSWSKKNKDPPNNFGIMSPCTKPQHEVSFFSNQFFFFYFLQSRSSLHHQTVRNEQRSWRVIVFLSFYWNILYGGHQRLLYQWKVTGFVSSVLRLVGRDSKSLALSHLPSALVLNAFNNPLKGACSKGNQRN